MSLGKLEYMNANLIEELLYEVGAQMANPDGPDFNAIVGTPALVAAFLEPAQVGELMGNVRDGIIEGTKKVVMDLPLEEKYQRVALNALRDGMRLVSNAFESFQASQGISSSGPSSGPALGYWEPKERFEEAVCCMEGMECWSGQFANAAGRGQLEADLVEFQF